ncbi:hypothetical protein BAUCODRAFT_115202 [Baudoinia panamericana UAMH 10762]|uniref:DUF336-domain-containing protein n=1 Tax=Baudoinia panamericana (strain UAMH 10762) TaxID=717646 RepID=M2N265_BAUPA|nr:uncharacterized protein BAUCODRAFT_115202 [Baudoinia panamericana UAMH 10762]EMC93074.1 hypothetical protein BAUCODRAFT_115202 [Baudoinia panamericana UAMH 10762]
MAAATATRPLPCLTLEAARIASAAAEEKAKQMGIDFNIALVDSTLHLLHFTRMPNAKLTSIQIAIDKAFTAAGHRAPTSNYSNAPAAKNFLPGGPAYGIHNSNGGRFTLIGGGVPIVVDGVVVGAIGVSTGTPAQDEEVARAGVEALNRRKGGAKL